MSSSFRKYVLLALTLVVILAWPIAASAQSALTSTVQSVSPPFLTKTAPKVSINTVQTIDEILHKMNQIGYQMMVLKNNGSSDEEWNKMFSEYKELEAQVQSLGAVKLTNEEKRKYVEMSYEYTQKQMSNAVILDFDPGDHYNDLTGNIDLYVINVTSYTPYGTYNVARVYTLIPPGATASVLSTTKSYTFYNSPNEGVIFGNKIMKAFVGTVWNITSFYIPDGVDVLLSVIFDQMNWPNGKPDISYGGAANIVAQEVKTVFLIF